MVAGRPAHCLQFNVGESSNHETTTVFVTSWWWWWWWCWCWPWWWIWMLANHHTTKQRQPLPPLVFAFEPTLLSTRSLCDFLQPSSALSTEMIGKKCPPLCSQQFYSTEAPKTRTHKSELLSQFLTKAPVFAFLSTRLCISCTGEEQVWPMSFLLKLCVWSWTREKLH